MTTKAANIYEERVSKGVYTGFFIGYIEYINDPMHLGRVKVRIPAVSSYAKNTSTEQLPWAYVVQTFGGGHDFGSKVIPPVGSKAIIIFENGNKLFPLVMGVIDSVPSEYTPLGRDSAKELPTGEISMSASPTEPIPSYPGTEGPAEFLQQVNYRPERIVPFKSMKGATLDIEERDEVEHFNVVDRSGQGIFMDSPIRAKASDNEIYPVNTNNFAQRGMRTSKDGDPLPIESTITDGAEVAIIDIGGQSITLKTKKNSNGIKIISKQGDYDTDSREVISGNKETLGKASVILDMSSGNKQFSLEIIEDGKIKSKLLIDGNTGSISIEASALLKINAENIILDGDVSISGNLNINKTLLCSEHGIFSGEVLSTEENGKYPLATSNTNYSAEF